MSEQKVPLQDQVGHEWAVPSPGESGRRARCIRCGAYRHLGSGLLSCPGPAAADAPGHTPGPWVVEPHGHEVGRGGDEPDLVAERDALRAEVGQLEKNCEALTAFKRYVHKRLDEAGVPADPESPHKAEGCRIGGRLDLVLARWAAFGELLAACKEGYRLSEIAVRQGLDFGPQVTEQIVRDHESLKQIRTALATARAALAKEVRLG